jgi:hypothetical protein
MARSNPWPTSPASATSRARRSRRSWTCLLAPDLQETLLFLPAAPGRDPIHLKELRYVCQTPVWAQEHLKVYFLVRTFAPYIPDRDHLYPLQDAAAPDLGDQDRGDDREDLVRDGSAHEGTSTMARPSTTFGTRWRRRRVAELTRRLPGTARAEGGNHAPRVPRPYPRSPLGPEKARSIAQPGRAGRAWRGTGLGQCALAEALRRSKTSFEWAMVMRDGRPSVGRWKPRRSHDSARSRPIACTRSRTSSGPGSRSGRASAGKVFVPLRPSLAWVTLATS